MSILPAALFDFDFFAPLPIRIEVSDAPLTSDAGLLPVRQFDERISSQGTNRRFVTTNRPGAPRYLEATHDEYPMRGETENRNKEFKCGMAMDRLSDHRLLANYFRLYLHAAALNLLVRLSQEIADAPPAPAGDVPVASLPEPERRQYQNARRRQIPWARASRRRGACS